jgi:transposase
MWQDRDGAEIVIEAIHATFPWLRHLFADAGAKTSRTPHQSWSVDDQIVKRATRATGFEVLARRWVVERTLAWLNRNRRLAKDFEASITSAKAWPLIASLQILIRRVARVPHNLSDS